MRRWGGGLSLLLCAGAMAADWPQFLGPDRNGRSGETNLSAHWPKEGPPVRWKVKLGAGWSGPVVASNQLVLFHRVDNQEMVQCLDVTQGGKVLWKRGYATTYQDDFGFDEGPRATPAIDQGRVYTFGADGMLGSWDLATGSNCWRIDTRRQFGSAKGFFGIACSPVVEGRSVILNIGGTDGAGVVAFDKTNGQVIWKSTTQEASYSSAAVGTMGGKRRCFVLGRSALIALDPNSGSEYWEFPFRPAVQASVSAATPIIVNDCIFVSASYGAGAALLRFAETKPVVIWRADDVLSNHYGTSVNHGGSLFGFDGRQEQRCNLRCVDLKTGQTRWSEDHFGAGHIIVAGDELLIFTERGELLRVAASAERFIVLARAQVAGSECRAAPALAGGWFYARDKKELICLDLRTPAR